VVWVWFVNKGFEIVQGNALKVEYGEKDLVCIIHRFSFTSVVTPLENFLWKCNMGYTLYPWISLLESTLETSYNVRGLL